MKKISSTVVFLLILFCFVSKSSAQLKVQTGIWNASKEIVNYMLAAGGEMERTLLLPVSFPKPFTAKPEVIVSITRYDGDTRANTRYDLKAVSVHKAGFTLEIKTWGGSVIHLIGGTWMAVGE